MNVGQRSRLAGPVPPTPRGSVQLGDLPEAAILGIASHLSLQDQTIAACASPLFHPLVLNPAHLLQTVAKLDGPVAAASGSGRVYRRAWSSFRETALLPAGFGAAVGAWMAPLVLSIPSPPRYEQQMLRSSAFLLCCIGPPVLGAALCSLSCILHCLSGRAEADAAENQARQQELDALRSASRAALEKLQNRGCESAAERLQSVAQVRKLAVFLAQTTQRGAWEDAVRRDDRERLLALAAAPDFVIPVRQTLPADSLSDLLDEALGRQKWQAVSGLVRGGAKLAAVHMGARNYAQRLAAAICGLRWTEVEALWSAGVAFPASLAAPKTCFSRATGQPGPGTRAFLSTYLDDALRDRAHARIDKVLAYMTPAWARAALDLELRTAVLDGNSEWALWLGSRGARLHPTRDEEVWEAARLRLDAVVHEAEMAGNVLRAQRFAGLLALPPET